MAMLHKLVWVGSVALAAHGSAFAGERYEGQAQAAGGAVLYRETHLRDGAREVVLYRCADGKAFARKQLDYAHGETAPDFDVLDARDGYRQGVRTQGTAREVFVAGTKGNKTAPLPANVVVDAGFDAFVRSKWDQLAAGKTVQMRFLVPSRLQAMEFKLAQTAQTATMRTFRLTFGAWFGGMLPQIDVDYDASTHRLLAYRGLTDVRNGRGGMIDARIRFPASARGNATAADLDAARAAPLDGRCTQ